MNESNNLSLQTYRIANIVMSVLTILLAVLLIVQCAGIFISGTSSSNYTESGVLINSIYSREIIAQRLSAIAWAFWLWLAALVVRLVLPLFVKKPDVARTELPLENRLQLRTAGVTATDAMKKERRKRILVSVGCGVVLLLCAAMVGGYVFNTSNFVSKDLETVVGAMLIWILPWIALAFVALIVRAQLCGKSMLRELEAAKDAPKSVRTEPEAKKGLPVFALRLTLYAAAVILLVVGVINGGMRDVLVKAVNICTECIGLG